LLLMTATLARSRHLLASQVVKGGMREVPVNTVCLASRWPLIAGRLSLYNQLENLSPVILAPGGSNDRFTDEFTLD
jgi:hypothetical protein